MAIWDIGSYFDWRPYWDAFYAQVVSPKVDSAELEAQLRAARAKLPKPVIWLLGKTQSGKSSIVRALTGASQIEVGNGFQPCTRTATLFSFPNADECLVRFLDTRGLGEARYDPAEDLAYAEREAHLLLVVVNAMDHALQPVVEAVRAVRQRRPNWPVIVAQTRLHDGYPPGQSRHPSPYPWSTIAGPPGGTSESSNAPVTAADRATSPAVPGDLTRSLAAQRAVFESLDATFVPIDFTLPEDGFDPPLYGIEQLWSAVETALPLGLRGMLGQEDDALEDLYLRTARWHIISYAAAAGAAGAIPVPLVDAPLVVAIQGKMLHSIAAIYGQILDRRLFAEFGGALGVGIVLRFLGRELTKVVPVFGSAVAGSYTAAATYALGFAMCRYFQDVRQGCVPDATRIRALYADELERGTKWFSEYLQNMRQ